MHLPSLGWKHSTAKSTSWTPSSGSPDAAVCGNPALKDSAFARGRYCKNNFNDLASSLVLLTEPPWLTSGTISSEEEAVVGAAQGSFWEEKEVGALAPVFLPGKPVDRGAWAGYRPEAPEEGGND